MSPLAGVVLGLMAFASPAEAGEFPEWAYPVNPPASSAPRPDHGEPQHVPGSSVALTKTQIAAISGQVPDWHPDEHPPMPGIVASGRPPVVYACGYCHLPTGAGRPENANLTGLTSAYIRQQMVAFRNGDRPGSEPLRVPQKLMIAIAQAASDAEITVAASYFASVQPAAYVTVAEAASVPKTIVAGWIHIRAPDGGFEPIGDRIIEIADDFERFEMRDSRTPYTAFVPVGSIRRGAALVATGGGKTLQCAACHGPELKGIADVPRLVGRSPSYLMRQLHDIRSGNRKGGTVELMKPVVANLSEADMVDVVAYLGSRAP